MTVKVTGKQWKDYLASWPDDWWHEDYTININGVECEDYDVNTIADDDVVRITDGIIYGPDIHEIGDQEKHLRKWLKGQTNTSFMVTCDKAIVESVKAAVKAAGGRCG